MPENQWADRLDPRLAEILAVKGRILQEWITSEEGRRGLEKLQELSQDKSFLACQVVALAFGVLLRWWLVSRFRGFLARTAMGIFGWFFVMALNLGVSWVFLPESAKQLVLRLLGM